MNSALESGFAWQALSLLAFSSAITPGPNNLMLLASSARFGLRRTLPHLGGVLAGTLSMVTLNVVGLGALMLAWAPLLNLLKFAGAGYLCYLAWRLTLAQQTPGQQNTSAAGAQPLTWRQAAVFQVINPKVWMMGLAVATTLGHVGLSDAAFGIALFCAIAFPCVLLWAMFGVVMLRLLTTPRARRVFNLTVCAMLLATAAMIMLA